MTHIRVYIHNYQIQMNRSPSEAFKSSFTNKQINKYPRVQTVSISISIRTTKLSRAPCEFIIWSRYLDVKRIPLSNQARDNVSSKMIQYLNKASVWGDFCNQLFRSNDDEMILLTELMVWSVILCRYSAVSLHKKFLVFNFNVHPFFFSSLNRSIPQAIAFN